MMRTMRPLTIAFLGLLFVATAVALTACGGDDNSKSSGTATPAASRTPAASSSSATSTRAAGASASATAGTRSPSASPSASTAEIKMVPTLKFDKSSLTIDAGKAVTLTVNNTETGVQHSFALYKTKADADANKSELASTKTCNGPCKNTVELNLAAGEYFFHCAVHPTQMTGKLIAK